MDIVSRHDRMSRSSVDEYRDPRAEIGKVFGRYTYANA